MKHPSAFAIVLFLTFAIAGQTAPTKLSDLAWLAGCWEMSAPAKNLLITEQWMKPAGGMMIGAGRTVKSGKAVDYEFLRIVEDADGIFYVAKPTGNKDETSFKLTKASAGEVLFENPAHDFPQRIIYKLTGNRLNARTEGSMNGKSRGIDFPYVRTKCD